VLRHLRPDSLLTLGVKIYAPAALDLQFNLTVDGKTAADRTLIGEGGKRPSSMPFARRTGSLAKQTWGAPREKPAPPYFLVWRQHGRQGSETNATLSEEARRELRALGYLQ